MRTPLLAISLLAALTVPVRAKTWYVGGSGADFSQIQPAIDAAVPGDTILVREGTYEAFHLDKAVMVAASAQPFQVKLVNGEPLLVSAIPAGQRAGISRVMMRGSNHNPACIQVADCAGEVVLSGLTLESDSSSDFGTRLGIRNCANVSVTGAELTSATTIVSIPLPSVDIASSSVRLNDIVVHAANGYDGTGAAGGVALAARSSRVILSGFDLFGGRGGSGYFDMFFSIPGGNGGDGVVATSSDLMILGAFNHHSQMTGGDGGEGWKDWTSTYWNAGGNGGDGFRGDAAVIAHVDLIGGRLGDGKPSGNDGQSWEGTVTDRQYLPFMTMTGDPLVPGATLDVSLWATRAGGVVLLLGDHGGFLPFPGSLGPPLSVLPFPGGRFLAAFVGRIDPFEVMTLTLTLPSDLGLRGFPVNGQAAVLGDDGTVLLTNSVTCVIGE